MKIDALFPAAILAVGMLYAANASSQIYGNGNVVNGEGGTPSITNDIHPVTISNAVSNSKAISGAVAAGGLGGAGGAASGGSASANFSDNSKTSAYALGLSLTTSQGECPFLGSANIGPVGFTYEVPLCGIFQRMKLVANAPGVSGAEKDQAYMNLICTDPAIRSSLAACVNR